jgi:hexosaminidase
MEHTFQYKQHKTVWEHSSPFTPEDILKLDRFCKKRHIELVANQNSFGHMHRWLKHDKYKGLAECPEGYPHPFAPSPEPFSLNATDPKSVEFVDELLSELLPHFTSKKVNVGCDETFDLGKGR